MGTEFFLFMALFLVAILSLPYLGPLINSGRNERIRERVFSGRFMTAEEFERDRMVKGFAGNYGSRYSDTSGCYVILIFDGPVAGGDFGGYRNGYVGQSVNVIARVHSHLTGKGNGDVYADRKNGKHVYVRLITCPVEELNSLEVMLIGAFDWKRLYNRNRGGGSRHGGVPDRPYSGTLGPDL